MNQQELLATILRRDAQSGALQQANNQAYSLDPVAAAAQMANNPGAAAAAQAAAQSQRARFKPVQMGTQGFMLPQSGEFAESPMYVDEKVAARDARESALKQTLEARAAEAQAKREAQVERDNERSALALTLKQMGIDGQMQTRLLARSLAGNSAADRRQDKLDRDAEKAATAAEKATDASVQKLAAFADKKQLPRLLTNAHELAGLLNKYEDKDIPGLGSYDVLSMSLPFGDRLLKDDAKANLSLYKGITNALTRSDAGLSQTQGEVLRQAMETFDRPTASAKTRATVLREQLLPLIEELRSSTLGSANPAAQGKYRDNILAAEGNANWMNPVQLKKKGAAAATAPGEKVPPGMDPNVWKFMTPQEKKLWLN